MKVLELERERRTRARVKRLAELVKSRGPMAEGVRWIEGVLALAGEEAANDDGRDEDASEDSGR